MQTLNCAMYTRCLILVFFVRFSLIFCLFAMLFCILHCIVLICLMFLLYVTFKNQKLTFRIISKLSVKHIVCRWLYFYFIFFRLIISFVLTVRLTYVRICRMYTPYNCVFTFEFALGECIHFLSFIRFALNTFSKWKQNKNIHKDFVLYRESKSLCFFAYNSSNEMEKEESNSKAAAHTDTTGKNKRCLFVINDNFLQIFHINYLARSSGRKRK